MSPRARRPWSDGYDVAGGLYHVRAREWAPDLGAFTAVDEFDFHDKKTTLWGWPHQNPASVADPFGRWGDPFPPPPEPPLPPPGPRPGGGKCDSDKEKCIKKCESIYEGESKLCRRIKDSNERRRCWERAIENHGECLKKC